MATGKLEVEVAEAVFWVPLEEGVWCVVCSDNVVDSMVPTVLLLVLILTVKGDIVNLTVSVAVLESDLSVVAKVWTHLG